MSCSIRKRYCRCCKRPFRRRPQNKHQRTCSRRRCQRARHKQACKRWHRNNPEREQRRQGKTRKWAQRSPDYWRTYRAMHPRYTRRERERMRRKRRGVRRVATRDAWRKIVVGKLQTIRAMSPSPVATRDAWDRRVDELLKVLVWKETVAKRDASPGSLVVPHNTPHDPGPLGRHPPAL